LLKVQNRFIAKVSMHHKYLFLVVLIHKKKHLMLDFLIIGIILSSVFSIVNTLLSKLTKIFLTVENVVMFCFLIFFFCC